MKFLLYFIVSILLFLAYVRYLEATMVFYPERHLAYTPKDAGLDYEDIYFKTIDNVKLNGWLVKAQQDRGVPGIAPTLIFLHGNAGNIGDRVEKVLTFCRLGVNVFIIDYRGYGNSKGRPGEQGLYFDAMAAWDYLNSRDDIDSSRILAYGASLGGAVAVDLATKRKLAGLILDSTFSSGRDMARVVVPFVPPFLLKIKLDSVSKIKGLTVPKLFIHSPGDETVPYTLARKLYDAAPQPKEFIDIIGSHNEGYALSQDIFVDALSRFLTRYLMH